MRHLKRYHQLFENTQELTQEQKDWLDECAIDTWQINPQTGLVDVEGDFYCPDQGLTDFKGVRFGNVSGDFNCSGNKLTSLNDAPKHVGESFRCQVNKLESLDGAPQSVGGDFSCRGNKLKSLRGAPQSVGVDFSCFDNSLTSLEGAPQKVGWGFYCSNNPISERAIKGVLRKMSDKKIPLEVAVEELWDELSEEDQVYLAKHHTGLSGEEKRIYRAIELNMKRR